MPRRRNGERVYWRDRSGVRRAYGDFRDYADVDGKREPLVALGEKMATTDPDVAQALAAERVRDLDKKRRGIALHGPEKPDIPLAAYSADHLVKKAKAGKVTPGWLDVTAVFLKRAAAFFGEQRDLATITVEDVEAWGHHLAITPYLPKDAKPDAKGRRLSSGTVRHALNALSNVYRRAQSEGKVAPGFNPVAALMEKPTAPKREARWLEVHEAALLLEAARTLPPAPPQLVQALPAETAHVLIATFLLTGGRRAEVQGLEVDDVSFDRQTITFRPNSWRRLKTLTSARVVPLWPQLAEILQSYILSRPPSRLLFPSYLTGSEALLVEWRGTLDRVAVRAGWKKGEIRTKMFRHSYCSARLQTLDGGAPVSPYTVSRELGHGSGAMVEKVYAHLGTVRHRVESVEYRVEQHRTAITERVERLGLAWLKDAVVVSL